MKLVLLADTLGLGGSERTVQIISNSYPEIDCVISIANEIQYEFNKEIKIITLLEKNYSGYIKVIIAPYILWKLYKALASIKPNAVVSFHFFSNILNVVNAKMLKYKSFLSERQYSQKYFGKKNIVMKHFIPFLYNKATGIICNDKDIKTSLQNFYNVKKPILVLNNLFKPFSGDRKKVKLDTVFRFLTVGRLSQEKNTKDIIKAFAKIKVKDSIELHIVGDGYLRKELEVLATSLGVYERIVFVGHTKNVAEYYRQSDAFVFSSLNEGFPNVILEAMSFGLPIISYRFKAGIETIIEENKYGILVDINDVDGLSYQMKQVLENKELYHKLVKLSRSRIAFFSNTEQYINKFKTFIEDAR